ncbi:DoxX family protein [Tomitella cavernea]|uniref:DoxX family protein n=1 Tax=Tomitella cavernea TaxID=1387982 RepID=A0ABP9C946_9ACTN|nr:DoxX family protein [Tomitella cavernea]
MNRPTGSIRSIGLLLARVGIGAVFLAHGLQKLNTWGHAGTAAAFDTMGAPLPDVSAYLATWVEILGGAALIAGLLVPLAGILLAVDMIGAILVAHIGNGIWVGDGGFELALALGAGALGLAVAGPGRISVDALLFSRARGRLGRVLAPAV